MPLPLLLLTPPPSTAATAPVPFRTKRQDAASTSSPYPAPQHRSNRPRPFSHKAAGCRFHFRLHADQSGGRGPARYSTRAFPIPAPPARFPRRPDRFPRRHPDPRAARPIPASPGPRSFSERASPRFSSPRPRHTARSTARATAALAEASRSDHAACRPLDPRATRTAKLQRARVAKVFVAKAASPRFSSPRPRRRPSTAHSTAALAEASRSDHAAGGCQRNIGPAPVPRPSPPVPLRTKRQDAASTSSPYPAPRLRSTPTPGLSAISARLPTLVPSCLCEIQPLCSHPGHSPASPPSNGMRLPKRRAPPLSAESAGGRRKADGRTRHGWC
jgi:hypothetical protein